MGAWGRASCKRQASGSNPLTGSQVKGPRRARRLLRRQRHLCARLAADLPCHVDYPGQESECPVAASVVNQGRPSGRVGSEGEHLADEDHMITSLVFGD
jgi:hypothetical protein